MNRQTRIFRFFITEILLLLLSQPGYADNSYWQKMTRTQVLELIQQTPSGEKPNLKQKDFRGEDMSYINFKGADLFYTHMRNVNLDGANFENATLDLAIMLGANLEGASFHNATLISTGMDGTNLNNADLSDA